MLDAVRDIIDVGRHPVLVREVCEHVMKVFLQDDWLTRYVATGKIRIPSLAGQVPVHIAQEVQKLEPVSLSISPAFAVPLISPFEIQYFASIDLGAAQKLRWRTLTVPVEIPAMQVSGTSGSPGCVSP